VIPSLELNRIQTGIESIQVGQGDNVIIVIKIPKIQPELSDEEYIKKCKGHIMKESQNDL